MKLTRVLLALGGAGLLGMAAVSAAGPNFAGTWELDKSKSQLSQGMANIETLTLIVTQDSGSLTVEQKVTRAESAGGGGGGGRGFGGGRGMAGPRTYKLDGSETTQEISGGQMTGKITSKAKLLDGDKGLEITNVSTFGERTNTTTEHWELAEGGKVLKIHRKTESQRGTQESTLVLVKK
jgi:hypothetical protein